jgi:hypothetical protein
MRHVLLAFTTVTTLATGSIGYACAASSEGVVVATSQVVEAKRETCWRTNLATKQKFKIC